MMCQRTGRPPISTIGFGITAVSSVRRVPKPPARMTTFINSPLYRRRLFLSHRLPSQMGPHHTRDRTAVIAAQGVAVDAVNHLERNRLALVGMDRNRVHGADRGIYDQCSLAQEITRNSHPADVTANRVTKIGRAHVLTPVTSRTRM